MMHTRGLSIHVQPHVGNSIQRSAEAMVELSTRLGVMLDADFNGLPVIATPDMTAQEIVDTYRRMLQQSIEEERRKGSPWPTIYTIRSGESSEDFIRRVAADRGIECSELKLVSQDKKP